jgi:hypothetical protein
MTSLRPAVFAATVGLLLTQPAIPARAESWMFRRSYYSHQPVAPVQVGGPTYSTRVTATRPYGEYFRAGYYQVHVGPNIRSSYERYYIVDSWFQGGAQY